MEKDKYYYLGIFLSIAVIASAFLPWVINTFTAESESLISNLKNCLVYDFDRDYLFLLKTVILIFIPSIAFFVTPITYLLFVFSKDIQFVKIGYITFAFTIFFIFGLGGNSVLENIYGAKIIAANVSLFYLFAYCFIGYLLYKKFKPYKFKEDSIISKRISIFGGLWFIAVHLWTTVVAYQISGIIAGILTLIVPFGSEIFWLFIRSSSDLPETYKTFALLGTTAIFIIFSITETNTKDKTKKDLDKKT